MTVMRIVLLAAATLLAAVWSILAWKYTDEYAELVDSIDAEKYKYPELFCIGFAIMKFLHIDTRSDKARKRIREISEIQGRKYAEYYFYVINGAKWTYGFTALTFFAVLGALADSGAALLFGAVLSGLLMWYLEELMNDRLEERRNELLSDLPQVLSKLALLMNSGMTMKEAWEKVADGGERALYQEMQLTVKEMRNGVSDLDSFRNFADRCAVKEIRRFSSTMIQNKQRGALEAAYFFKEMSDDMWEEKKHLARRKGEAANSKLLIPIGMIFVGILIMIIVPTFANM